MGSREIIIKNDHEEISNYAAFLVNKIIKNNNTKITNIALSGGNTPILMFEKLAKLTKINWSNIHIFLVDERYVDKSDPDSNFRLIDKHLISKIEIPKDNIHYIKYYQDIRKSLLDYKKDLKTHFNLKNNNDLPHFDLIHLGIGGDGHTASIFKSEEGENGLLQITQGKKHARITFTYNVINNAENIMFLVTGKKKKAIIKNILENQAVYPASQVRTSGNLFFLLDEKSANLLKK